MFLEPFTLYWPLRRSSLKIDNFTLVPKELKKSTITCYLYKAIQSVNSSLVPFLCVIREKFKGLNEQCMVIFKRDTRRAFPII